MPNVMESIKVLYRPYVNIQISMLQWFRGLHPQPVRPTVQILRMTGNRSNNLPLHNWTSAGFNKFPP